MAKKVNLRPEYTGDGYIYLVDENGNPTAFHGIEGDLNPDGTDCCLRCTVHTQEKWEQYKNENPWVDQPTESTEPGSDTPKDPDNGGNWWDDLWPFG